MKNSSGNVKFIRKGGRIIPILDKSGKGKKLPKVTNLIKDKVARRSLISVAAVAGAALFARKFGGKTLMEKMVSGTVGAVAGAAIGKGVSNIKKTRQAKGETNEDTAKRVAVGNKVFKGMVKKGNTKASSWAGTNVYDAEFFKPKKVLGFDLNTHSDEKLYKKLKKVRGRLVAEENKEPRIEY